jgi:chromate transport protein ChrA
MYVGIQRNTAGKGGNREITSFLVFTFFACSFFFTIGALIALCVLFFMIIMAPELECEICGRNFPNAEVFDAHVQEFHAENPAIGDC